MINNRPHQVELARSLIDTLGFDGAIYACQSNAWEGVLACVLADRGGLTRQNV
jgi:hypothetical protein